MTKLELRAHTCLEPERIVLPLVEVWVVNELQGQVGLKILILSRQGGVSPSEAIQVLSWEALLWVWRCIHKVIDKRLYRWHERLPGQTFVWSVWNSMHDLMCMWQHKGSVSAQTLHCHTIALTKLINSCTIIF